MDGSSGGTYCLKIISSNIKDNYEKIHEYFFDKIIEINKQRYNYNVGSSFIFNSQQIYEYSLDIKISNSNITNTIYIKNNSDSAQQTIYDFIKKYCK